MLHISPSTLQSRLTRHGASYLGLLDAIRKELAHSYLQQPSLSMTEITFLLGFGNVSNFTRAFKRWHGVPPTQFRAGATPRIPEIAGQRRQAGTCCGQPGMTRHADNTPPPARRPPVTGTLLRRSAIEAPRGRLFSSSMKLIESITTLALSDNPRLRARLRSILMVVAIYGLSLLGQWHAVRNAMADPESAKWLVWMIAIGMAVFYGVVRAGLTLRLPDPALTQPQMVFGILAIALAYHINPQVRGALPMLAGLVIMFGAFALSPVQARRLGWFAVVVFGATMALGAWRQPAVFQPIIEVHHFLSSPSRCWQ
jgi:hypothetical protein